MKKQSPKFVATLVRSLLPLALAAFHGTAVASAVPPAPDVDARSYVLMDTASGRVLAAKAENQRLEPASLTKLMTVYLAFDGLQRGTLKLDETVAVSPEAWKTGGSRMFIQPLLPVNVEQLIQGLVVVSGNDAAVALAETMGGSTDSFVQIMNRTAQQLGLKNTHYVDVNGLPQAEHYSSAYDLALLSRDIIARFPQYLHYFGEKTFTYNKITQRNWNPLVFSDPTVDGLKTGHTDEAGFCLDATAVRQNRRLVALVMGSSTRSASASAAEALLNFGYRNFETDLIYPASQRVGSLNDVRLNPMTVPVGTAGAFYAALPVGDRSRLRTNLMLAPEPKAPVARGQVVGTIVATVDGAVVATVPAVALAAAAEAGVFKRAWNRLQTWL
ncbi:MAG: D-alanyl-D-alanine carboxypeptidase [Sulfuricellaceae bacterium]|nr:D-alanyl-D-alanine carboxypeptidase [Sulfuricellaceae bacterium]